MANMIRDDLSDKLIHLTRGGSDQAAAEAFLSIVQDRAIRGGTGCIKGRFHCVCFSEAPVSKLCQILANPSAHGMRYRPFGIMLEKCWLFEKGGRPVIYQADTEYDLLHDSQKFRHVRYEPNDGVDFTWEREWRVCTEKVELDSKAMSLVVPNREWEKWFHDQHVSRLAMRAIVTMGYIGPKSVSEFPWHFIVLDDLGVKMPHIAPPKPLSESYTISGGETPTGPK